MPNAYSRPFEAPIIQYPIGAIAQAAQQIQEKEDYSRDALDALSRELSTAVAAPGDRQGLQKLVDSYRQRIADVSKRGFLFDRMRQIRSMAADFHEQTSYLGSRNAAFQKNLEELEKSDHSPEDKALRRAQLLKNYQPSFDEAGNLVQGLGYTPQYFAKPVNFAEKVSDYADKFDPISFKRELQSRGFRIPQEEGKSVPEDMLRSYIVEQLSNDSEAKAYLQDEANALRASGASEEDVEKHIRSLYENSVDAAVRAKADIKMEDGTTKPRDYSLTSKSDDVGMFFQRHRWELERESRENKKQEEAARPIYVPGITQDLGPEEIDKMISKSSDPAEQGRLRQIKGIMENDFIQNGLPKGVDPETYRRFKKDRESQLQAATGVSFDSRAPSPFATFQLGGSGETAKRNLKLKYENYSTLENAYQQEVAFSKKHSLTGEMVVPGPDAVNKLNNWVQAVGLPVVLEHFDAGSDKANKRLAEAEDIKMVAGSISNTFGTQFLVSYKPKGKDTYETIKLKAKVDGDDGLVSSMFEQMNAPDMAQEYQASSFKPGADWTRVGNSGIAMKDTGRGYQVAADSPSGARVLTTKDILDAAERVAPVLASKGQNFGNTQLGREIARLLSEGGALSEEEAVNYLSGKGGIELTRKVNQLAQSPLTFSRKVSAHTAASFYEEYAK